LARVAGGAQIIRFRAPTREQPGGDVSARGGVRVRWTLDGWEHCKSLKVGPLADGFFGDPKGTVRHQRLITCARKIPMVSQSKPTR
jgi:hypothetical protein